MRTDPVFGKSKAAREALLRAGGLTIKTTIEKPSQVAAIRAVMGAIPARDPSGKAAAALHGASPAPVRSSRWRRTASGAPRAAA